MIKSIRFQNYKSFKDYTVHFTDFNILVGPNNCGKSTIIGAIRLLDIGFKKARSSRASNFYLDDNTRFQGYKVNTNIIDVSTENVSHNYEKVEPVISFTFDGKRHASLYFLSNSDCYLTCDNDGSIIIAPSQFKRVFSNDLKCIPILGPLEHNEDYVTKETVVSNVNTHRASRNFRNYWYHFPENWDYFNQLIKDTWSGMEMDKPYLDNKNIYLMCRENRISRELYWVGYGFQIWCQILTHISMLDTYSVVVIDEPEIYLHAEVQRQLISILHELDKQIIIATHSVEILGEANPEEVLIIEKDKDRSYRIKNIDGVQRAISLVGSIHNITLANLARTRKMLCVENISDYIILSKFMRKYFGNSLEKTGRITPVGIEGSSFIQNVRSFSWGLKEKFNLDIDIGVVIDRDFYSDESIKDISEQFNVGYNFIHVLEMKEIENYFLDFDAITSCISKFSSQARDVSYEVIYEEIIQLFISITDPLKTYVLSQISANRLKTKDSSIDPATNLKETFEIVETIWNDINKRRSIVPGKKVLHELRNEVQNKYKITLSDSKIIDNYQINNIPDDMKILLDKLINFTKKI